MDSQGTFGAGSSTNRKGPALESEMMLADFFAIACRKIDKKTGNMVVEKVLLPSGDWKVRCTPMGSAILSSWVICFVVQLAKLRSFKGSVKANKFTLLNGSVHPIVIPRPGNSAERTFDGKEFATELKQRFVYEGEYPPYFDHLIYLLEHIPHGPLLKEYQYRLVGNLAQMTWDGRVNLVRLLKGLRDSLDETTSFDKEVGNSDVKSGWYTDVGVIAVLRKVAFYNRPQAELDNPKILPPIPNTKKGAFEYIRNHGTHIEEHMQELGLKFYDGSELMIPHSFGNFLAQLMDRLLRSPDHSERAIEIVKSCLPSPVLVGQLGQVGAIAAAWNALSCASSSGETRILTEVEILQQRLEDQQALVKKLQDDLIEAKRLSFTTDESTEIDSKIRLNISVIGHMGSGKSTTTGHLMLQLGGIQNIEMDIIESEAIEQNKQSSKYAWILDRLKAEREKGTTMEINLGRFETQKYCCTLFDSPGSRDYITAFIAGTSQVDCALLLIDSTTANFETGMSTHGQTREHALLASAFGVKQIICCCNKMEATSPPYSSERFNEIVTEVSQYLQKIGFKPDNIHFIPISAFHGDNLVQRSNNTRWYKGNTLFEAFDKIAEPKRPSGDALRIPLRGDGYHLSGTNLVAVPGFVVTGIVKPGTLVRISPGDKITRVDSLQSESDKRPLQKALPGDNVTLVSRPVMLN